MYSILIKISDTSYQYATNADGTIWTGDVEAAKTKLLALMENYTLGRLSVVHNATVTATLSIADVL